MFSRSRCLHVHTSFIHAPVSKVAPTRQSAWSDGFRRRSHARNRNLHHETSGNTNAHVTQKTQIQSILRTGSISQPLGPPKHLWVQRFDLNNQDWPAKCHWSTGHRSIEIAAIHSYNEQLMDSYRDPMLTEVVNICLLHFLHPLVLLAKNSVRVRSRKCTWVYMILPPADLRGFLLSLRLALK